MFNDQNIIISYPDPNLKTGILQKLKERINKTVIDELFKYSNDKNIRDFSLDLPLKGRCAVSIYRLSESELKLTSYTLRSVYEHIFGDRLPTLNLINNDNQTKYFHFYIGIF